MIANTPSNHQYYIVKDSIESLIKEIDEKITSSKEESLQFLENVDNKLQDIYNVLKDYETIFSNELECFVQIETYIIYIVGNNCNNKNFGHLKCTYYLLDIFKELFDAKINYLTDKTEYDDILNNYPIKLKKFRHYFNEQILIHEPKYDVEIDKLNIAMRGS
jgi:hypothetical protein